MQLNKFEYIEPLSLDGAASALDKCGSQGKIKAGGTSLIPAMKLGLIEPKYVVNISSIPHMDIIEFTKENGLRIGALASLYGIRTTPFIKERYPGLAEAVGSVSTLSMHFQSTIGGNICQDTRCKFYNQSRYWRSQHPKCYKTGGDQCLAVPSADRCSAVYRGDLAPALISMGASVILKSNEGKREISLAEFFTGSGKKANCLRSEEILTEIRVPTPEPGTLCVYEKARIRTSLDYPIAGAGILVQKDSDVICTHARIVLTALGPGPVIVATAEAELLGKIPNEKVCHRAAEAVKGEMHPVANIESTPVYRRDMARALVYRGLTRAFGLGRGVVRG